MCFKFCAVFLLWNAISVIYGAELFGPYPRIATDNGHLTIYGAVNKNVSIQTKGTGVINLNGANLDAITKEAQLASQRSKTMKNLVDSCMSTVTQLSDLVEGPNGLEKRVTNLETNSSIFPVASIPNSGRNRNIQALSRRVRSLEIKMARIIRLLNKNECSSNPCKNGGKCQDVFNGYICQCTDAWEGPLCDTDVNECLRFVGTDLGCQNGATCVNKPGTYECVCPPGWFGIHCMRKTNDCSKGSSQELCAQGTCVPQNTAAGYKCICDQGWTTDGIHPACNVDVNECESSKPHCSVNPMVTCINVPGTYYCGNCPAGYTGNGYYCTDIDECLTANGGCSLLPKVQCINTLGSRMCGPCPPGYAGDGITCTYRGICQVDNGGCHPLARCLENPHIGSTYVQCICPPGYEGSGMGLNGCVRNSVVPFSSPCNSNPCIHGTCRSTSNTTFQCICNNGYSGVTCNVFSNACLSNPCQNGGKCIQSGPNYMCECTNSFTGKNCETERQACGGKLLGPVGFLRYPENNSTNYGHSISCSWVIQTSPDLVLNVTFAQFNVEGSNDCLFDWLQIHDGPNSAAHIIGRYCGNQLPQGGNMLTSRNSIYLWFRSDHTVSSSGFSLHWTAVQPVCGGTISVTSHGVIKSPGFPGNYPPNRDCVWSLSAPFGKRIQFHFFTLMIGNNANCSSDYVKIYSGIDPTYPELASYCNTSHPEPLITSTSSAAVYFHSDATGNYQGFQISYSIVEGFPGCGGTFTSENGELSSPINTQGYLPNMDCEYKIRVPVNERIKVTFTSFGLEKSSNCKFDYVMIRDGGQADAPLVGKYCDSKIPPPFISSTNELFIRFKTDSSGNLDGFKLKYESICGGVYSSPTGIIKSPGYPITYPKDKICIYEIVQPLSSSILLQFQYFDVEQTSYPNCYHDYLEVRDGDNENATLIGKYCGGLAVAPPEIISTHNYLWMKFRSDALVTGTGFLANYSTIDLRCGGIMKENLGIIKSPGYPEKYLGNEKCSWIIVAPTGFIIQLTWISFNLESSLNCVLDYVTVYDNNTDTGMGGIIGKYCGKTSPPNLLSSSNVMTIRFFSDRSLSFDGFIMHYSFIDQRKICGGKYFTSNGVIRSPNYPNRYPPKKDCTWVITVPQGQQIMLNVSYFNVEEYIDCRSDYLEIRNGAFESSPLIGVFCGNSIPRQIPSHTNSIFLKFHSDESHAREGFEITWNGASRGCGGKLNAPSGTIISPNYPEPYGKNAICTWNIATSAGSVLQMMFTDLELENQFRCVRDYVQIFDGPDIRSKSLGRFCWESQTTSFIKTSSNKALVRFRSDVSRQERGFRLKFLTNCNNTLKGFKGVIETPNYPNAYPSHQDCTWVINAPRGNKINITFSHFDIERPDNKRCTFDYIQIKEGDLEYEEEVLLEKYCGADIPQMITSTKDIVHIHFVSDSMVQRSGFRLEWAVVGCGGILTHPTGTITTPGYPYGYPSDTTCEWIIQLEINNSIELTINKFDMEKSMDCAYDYLEIFNGPNEHAPSLTKVCHNFLKPVAVTTTGNVMFVRFVSDSSYTGKGFTASYKSVPIQCGGKYMTPVGSVHSQNYPLNYKNNEVCDWLIEVAPDHRVELTFHEFDLVSTPNCTGDYLELYDGKDENGILILHHCGNVVPNETIHTTSNTLFIKMVTDFRLTSKGFLANYTTGCGAQIVTDGTGMINFMDSYSWFCEWTVIAKDPEKHISLTINHMELSTNCDSPTLKIYEGRSSSDPEIGNYCGTKVPPMIVSRGNSLFIELNSAYGVVLQATYSSLSSSCGGNLTSLNGYFASPGYPDNYPVNSECEWRINLAPGNKVLLSFLDFDITETEYCNADFVEVREDNEGGKVLGTYCGSEIPNNLTESSSLWIQFRSSNLGTAKGFLAEYNLVHGNDLFGSHGKIGSPLYPNVFNQMDDFNWRITVDFHNVIQIKFLDFSIDWYSGDDCYLTGLEIYDGYDSNSQLLSKLCDLKKPEPLTSTSNVVYIQYYGSSFRHGLKFLLEWTQVQKPHNIKDISKTLSGDKCGTDFIIDLSEIKNYTVESPGYPLGYAGNLKCEWIFSTSVGNHLSIEYQDMHLEGNDPECVMDSVKVYSGIDGEANWELVDTSCLSNVTRKYKIHASRLMKIVFTSDMYINGTGFSAAVNTECGGSLKGPNGIISYWNETYQLKPYASQVVCEWNVTVKTGRTIEIKFLEFDIKSPAHRSCDYYVLLRNGIYADSPLLGNGKYCGSTIPQINTTTGNSFNMKYKALVGTGGFKLSYKEVSLACGGSIRLTDDFNSTYIQTPNYPNIPPPHTECIWVISVPPGESVQLDFVEVFDITYSYRCTKAGVEIRDGGTSISPLIGVFCETTGTQKSTDNILYVRFFTDVSDPRNGFKASIKIAECGGTIRGKTGSITTPKYPQTQMYPASTVCTWHIVGPPDHYLTLNFSDFLLPYRANCSTSTHLIIKEKQRVENETVLGVFCGFKKPAEFRSTSNEVTIQLITGQRRFFFRGFKLNFFASQEECGGTIEADSGVITTPGYPEAVLYNRVCEWRIKVPRGRRVIATILDIDIDSNYTSSGSGLAFFNDEHYNSYIYYMHRRFEKVSVKSSTNFMLVYYWTSRTSHHRGFKLSFKSDEPTICLGDLNNETGEISNPKNMSVYYCDWIRNSDTDAAYLTNRSLSLLVNAPKIGTTDISCIYSQSKIVVTTGRDTPKLAELCGVIDGPLTIRTPFLNTKIQALQSKYHLKYNFTIKYKVQPCGGVLTSSYGTITSPGFPNRYQESVECAWLIKLEEAETIKINFTVMDLDQSCTKDYVTVHNGGTPNSPKIGHYCGKTLPSSIQSQSNEVWIDYHGSSGGVGNGFSLNYESLTDGCGGIYHDRTRIIASPNYPNKYPNDADCLWEVQSPEGYHVGLKFVERYQIESSQDCKNDFIEIWDYKDNDWVSMGRVCGRDKPEPFNSTTNKMRIRFRSNSNLTASGFKATWHFNCGGVFEATEEIKYIVSPGYPREYTPGLNCKYDIVGQGKYVNVIFEDFALEKGLGAGNCRYDNVSIYRSRYYTNWKNRKQPNNNVLVSKYCGVETPPPMRYPKGITIILSTDKWVNRKGFKLKYFLDKCGGPITKQGEISSAKDIAQKENYYGSSLCIWNITAPENKVIVLRFELFELEYHRKCQYDYVQLFNGYELNNKERLAQLCGNITSQLPVFRSNSNKMIVKMHTDMSNQFRGFKAIVTFTYGENVGCGGTINLTSSQPTKTLNSPDIDKSGQYVPNLDCHWLIVVPISEIIELTFESFHMSICPNATDTNKCNCDYLEIRDGGGSLSELVSQICGHDLPKTILSSGNLLWIRMVTDSLGSSSGFKAKVRKVISPCGPSILNVTNVSHLLSSPNYPNDYPTNIRCTWVLRSNSSSAKIEIRFKQLNLQEPTRDNKCENDKLQISDTNDVSSLARSTGENFVYAGRKTVAYLVSRWTTASYIYCGKGTPTDYYSTKNEIIISFVSDESITSKGFLLEYREAGCNRNYSNSHGRIVHDRIINDCYSMITAPANYTISLYFQSFLLLDSHSCRLSGIEIYDGNSSAAPQLAKLCGYQSPNPIFSTGNVLWLHSYSNRYGIGVYNILYTITNQGPGCGGTFHDLSGKFTSPMYPNNYRNNTLCRWEIMVPRGLQVAFRFITFDLGTASTCDSNFVQLLDIDVTTKEETEARRYCGGEQPAVFTASGNMMTVQYKSSVNNIGTGWVASFVGKTTGEAVLKTAN